MGHWWSRASRVHDVENFEGHVEYKVCRVEWLLSNQKEIAQDFKSLTKISVKKSEAFCTALRECIFTCIHRAGLAINWASSDPMSYTED